MVIITVDIWAAFELRNVQKTWKIQSEIYAMKLLPITNITFKYS